MTFTAFLAALAMWGSSMTMTGVGAPTVVSGGTIAQVGNPAYVRNATAATSAAFTGLSASAGDTQVCVLDVRSLTAITAPTNFTLITSAASGANHKIWAWQNAGTLAASVTVTTPSTTAAGACVEFSGVLTSGPVDVSSSLANDSFNTANPYTSGAVTPTASNEEFLAYFTISIPSADNCPSTAPAGFAQPTGTANPGGPSPCGFMYLQNNPALSSTQPSKTWADGNEDPAAAYIVLKHS